MTTTTVATTCTWLPAIAEFGERVEPGRPQEVADVLAACARDNRPVVPFGGGRALPLGNLTDPQALGLSLAGLGAIRSYEATDMTLSVEAGVTLGEINRVLGERGQMIPIEAPEPDSASIGGLLATALTGPRRFGGGTLRDVLIGIEIAYPDGSIGRAGGMVVKNVSGFDMMRLHHGALGSLGVITSANFKVLAKPRNELTFVSPVPDIDTAASISESLRPIADRPVALVIRSTGTSITISARYEGRQSGLQAVRSRVGAIFVGGMVLENEDSADYWQDIINERQYDPVRIWRIQIGCRPSETFAKAQSILASAGSGVRAEIEPGLGTITIEHDGDLDLQALRRTSAGANIRILDAPLVARQLNDIWGEPPSTLDLMRRLKDEYDPGRVLNRGRYAGYL